MTDVTTPSPRLTNRQAVHANLRQRIITLQILPGSSLSENELAAELNVSRTPVREVLILLADEGLVEVFPQIGTFVSLVDPQRVRDAQFLREAVEVTALRDVPSTPDPWSRRRRIWTVLAGSGSTWFGPRARWLPSTPRS